MRRPLPFRVIASWPSSLTACLLAALVLSPACQKAEADDAALGLEHALRDTRTSLAALGVSPSPEAAFPLIERERVTMTSLVPPLLLVWLH